MLSIINRTRLIKLLLRAKCRSIQGALVWSYSYANGEVNPLIYNEKIDSQLNPVSSMSSQLKIHRSSIQCTINFSSVYSVSSINSQAYQF